MAGTARRPRNAGATRDALLDTARELFAERGYDRTTLRDLGTRAGVDPALIARYFGSKEGLYRSVLVSEAAPAAVEGGPRGVAELLTGLWEQGPPGPAVQGLVRTDTDPELHAAAAERLEQRLLGPLTEQLAAAGTQEPRLRAELVLALLVGAGMARATGSLPALAGASREELLALLGPALDALGASA